MSRAIVDADLREWEVYATTGKYGFPAPGRVVFQCTSDRSVRPRVVEVDGNHAETERLVRTATSEELQRLFAEASELA